MNQNFEPHRLRELCRHVLLVEDSVLIAMDAEVLLSDLGAEQVTLAATVAEALNALHVAPPTIAILDVKLQGETCFPIADRLQVLQVPYAFATGYSDPSTFPDRYKLAPCMSKPFNGDSLRRIIEGLASSSDYSETQSLQRTA